MIYVTDVLDDREKKREKLMCAGRYSFVIVQTISNEILFATA
jgi:hypothetical protein